MQIHLYADFLINTPRSVVDLICDSDPWLQRADYKVICGVLAVWGRCPNPNIVQGLTVHIYMFSYSSITLFNSKSIYTLSKDDLKVHSSLLIINMLISWVTILIMAIMY